MQIRATPASRRSRSSAAVAAALVLTATSCGPSAPENKQPAGNAPIVRPEKSADCLAAVWKAQGVPGKAFDRAHDKADGGALSCATGTSASEFAAALAAIRRAAARRDRAALASQVGLPLLFIDASGTKTRLDRDRLAADAAQVFSPSILAMLERLELDDLSVVPQEGAFADLGAVWLVAGRTGGRPKIVTIDLQALEEAAATRRASPPT